MITSTKTTAVFIDGAYLRKLLRTEMGAIEIDFSIMVRDLIGTDELLRAYYYDALPYQGYPPSSQDIEKCNRRQAFFDTVRHLDKFEVREGRCVRIPEAGTWRYVQKRVDILLALDICRLAFNERIDKAVILTGDADFTPALQAAKDEGVEVVIATDNRSAHRDLIAVADSRIPLDNHRLKQWVRGVETPLVTPAIRSPFQW